MTDSTRSVQDRTDDLRRASKTLADRIDAVAEEVTRARGRLGRRLRRVEEAMSELKEDAEGPNAKVATAIDELAAEARRSFERIVTRKRPRRFFLF
jgi:predicted  nucleic acid-binding Zn-ribbon protein